MSIEKIQKASVGGFLILEFVHTSQFIQAYNGSHSLAFWKRQVKFPEQRYKRGAYQQNDARALRDAMRALSALEQDLAQNYTHFNMTKSNVQTWIKLDGACHELAARIENEKNISMRDAALFLFRTWIENDTWTKIDLTK